ncbi:MAG: hypothetical protein ACOC8K_09115, partial [Gemmatimonadota bacterium]
MYHRTSIPEVEMVRSQGKSTEDRIEGLRALSVAGGFHPPPTPRVRECATSSHIGRRPPNDSGDLKVSSYHGLGEIAGS